MLAPRSGVVHMQKRMRGFASAVLVTFVNSTVASRYVGTIWMGLSGTVWNRATLLALFVLWSAVLILVLLMHIRNDLRQTMHELRAPISLRGRYIFQMA
jgi:hypothetical protein